MEASRRSELAAVLPLAAAQALVMASLFVLKPVRNALLLDRLGIASLPHATIAVAILGIGVGGAYARAAQHARLERVAMSVFALVIASLAVFRVVMPAGGGLPVFLFYVVTALAGPLLTSVVWLRATGTLDARQARRLFRVVGTGGIIGAIAGGLLTRAIVHALGAYDVLLVAAGLLGCALIVLHIGSGTDASTSKANAATLAATSKATTASEAPSPGTSLIRALAMASLIGSVVSVIIDIQCNDFVNKAYASREAKAAFFGTFFAALSALALVCQLWIGPRLLASRGLGAALLALPTVIGIGSAALFVAPSLAMAVGLKLADGGLRHSVHKSTSEILVIPLSASERARAKPWLDTTVPAVGEALGAALVLALVSGLHVNYTALAVPTIVLAGIWLFASGRARAAYVDAFRRALARRQIDVADLEAGAIDASTRIELLRALESDRARTVAYSLDLLGAAWDDEVAAAVTPLLKSRSADIRTRALAAMRAHRSPIDAEALDSLLDDVSADVRVEAMRIDPARARAFLEDEKAEVRVRVSALAAVAAESRDSIKEGLVRNLLELARGDDAARAQIASALGEIPSLHAILRELTVDRCAEVVAEAIASVGRTRDEGVLEWLTDQLASARHRRQAREALASFGDRALDVVAARLADGNASRVVQRELLRVCAAIPTQASVDLIEKELAPSASRSNAVVSAAVAALGRMRHGVPSLRYGGPSVQACLTESLRVCVELDGEIAAASTLTATPEERLLGRALGERRAAMFARSMSLLSLLYPTKDVKDAFHALSTPDEGLRPSAVEFLDNVLSKQHSTPLLRVIEGDGQKRPSQAAREVERTALLERLVGADDAWLRAVAVFCAAAHNAASVVERGRQDPDPTVREAAGARSAEAAERIGGVGGGAPDHEAAGGKPC